MHTRVLVGVGAWLLGAVAATGGSLLAVSLLGHGIVDGASQQQLTSEAVNRALASEAAEPGATTASRSTGTAVSASAGPEPPSRTPTTRSAGGTVLASAGGTVVARCGSAGAYLASWSPQQGYEASDVVRGPATSVRLTFRSTQRTVTMVISCVSGVPKAATYVHNSGSGDD